MKKRKLKEEKKRKELEAEHARTEQLSKKRQREERRERYREQDKLKKKIRRSEWDSSILIAWCVALLHNWDSPNRFVKYIYLEIFLHVS